MYKCNEWINFLDNAMDERSQLLLQEWFGYCMADEFNLQKMMTISGPATSGKSSIVHMLKILIGAYRCVDLTVHDMGTHFGLSPMVSSVNYNKHIFIQEGFWDECSDIALSRIQSITSGDSLIIDRKGKRPVSKILNSKITITEDGYGGIRKALDMNFIAHHLLVINIKPPTEALADDLWTMFQREAYEIIDHWGADGFARVKSDGFTDNNSDLQGE